MIRRLPSVALWLCDHATAMCAALLWFGYR